MGLASWNKLFVMKAIALVLLLAFPIISSAQKNLFCHAVQRIPETRNPDPNRGCAPLDNSYHFWDVGKTLNVKILNGSLATHAAIMNIAKQWEQYGNLTFRFVDSGPAQIRIRLHNDGYISAMQGMLANTIPEDEANVFIDTSYFSSMSSMQAIVLHVFGHVIGFQHEIKVPLTGRVWNRKNVDKYFHAFGWNSEKIQRNIVDVYSVSYSNGIAADPSSVMTVPLPKEWTNERPKEWNPVLSEGDKKLMQLLYPDSTFKPKEQSGMVVTDFKGIRIEQTASGIIFYPEVRLTVRNVKSLIFYVFLVDEEGEPIYNAIEEPVAASLTYPSQGSKVYAINKSANDFGFFISYADIPLKYRSQKLKVLFNIYYVDSEYEQKAGYRSKPYDFIWPQ